MFVEFESLPNSSRVWIYQSDREFTNAEVDFIKEKAIAFIDGWTRHGDNLKGSFTVKYNQFLVLAVDESFNNVSGCSIDSSVRFIQEIEKELQLDLMNKMIVAFKEQEFINLVTLSGFRDYINEGKISSETIVFNNMVDTKHDFEVNWEVPAKQSWHNRFLV